MTRSWRLHRQIVLLLAAAVISSVGLFSAVAVWYTAGQIGDAAEEEQTSATELAAVRVEQTIQTRREGLDAVAGRIQDDELFPQPDEEALRQRFMGLLPASFDRIHVVHGERVIFSLPPTTLDHDPIAGLHVDSDADVWVGVPLPQRADPPIIVARIPAHALVDALFQHGGEREMAVVQDGRVVVDTLESGDVRVLESHTGPGERLRTEAPVEGTPLAVVAFGAASSGALYTQAVAAALAVAVVMIAIGVAVGSVLSRRVTAPIEEVADVADRLRRGDWQARVRPSGALEVARLGANVNAMAADLARDRNELLLLQRDLQGQVEDRTRQLAQRQEEMEQFFYAVSHDIKGPAIGIAGIFQMLEESMGRPDARQRQLLEHGRASADQLRRLVEDLLQFAAAERLSVEPIDVDLRQVVREAVGPLLATARDRGVTITVQAPHATVRIDIDILKRCIQNLVRNAVIHMPEGRRGLVQAEASIEDGDLVVDVIDNGNGLPKEVHDRLFAPFARPGNSKGSGIGLSIVRKLVHAHQGSISCQTRKGRGTAFRMRFPHVVRQRPALPVPRTQD